MLAAESPCRVLARSVKYNPAASPHRDAAAKNQIRGFPAAMGRNNYSSFGIAIDRKHALQWLFHHWGPRRRALVAGVEEKATFHCSQKVYAYSETALDFDHGAQLGNRRQFLVRQESWLSVQLTGMPRTFTHR